MDEGCVEEISRAADCLGKQTVRGNFSSGIMELPVVAESFQILVVNKKSGQFGFV